MSTSFRFEHEFPDIPMEKFIAHLNDPELNKMLSEGLPFESRELISIAKDSKIVEWQFLVKVSGELPKPIQKILKSNSICWREISVLVREDNRIDWQILPSNDLLRFRGKGIWRISPYGKGCKRIIEGDFTVDLPLIGKVIEGYLVSELKKVYEIEPSIQTRFYKKVA